MVKTLIYLHFKNICLQYLLIQFDFQSVYLNVEYRVKCPTKFYFKSQIQFIKKFVSNINHPINLQ